MKTTNESEAFPPPNGFTKAMRRLMSVMCLVAFFALIFGQVLGYFVKDVPTVVLFMLFAGSLLMFDSVNELVKKFAGGDK